MHQDQFYLNVQPGTCLASWMALDRCDEENGCLQVVPGTQALPLLCTVKADTTQSFTDVTVPLPEGMKPVPVIMEPGTCSSSTASWCTAAFPTPARTASADHSSATTSSARRKKVAQFYHPVLRMDGSVVELEDSPGATQCGVSVERDGTQVIEVAGLNVVDAAIHD